MAGLILAFMAGVFVGIYRDWLERRLKEWLRKGVKRKFREFLKTED